MTVVIAACGGTGDEMNDANPIQGELLVEQGFDTLPDLAHWTYETGYGGGALDTQYGSPLPSFYFGREQGHLYGQDQFVFDHQSLAMTVEAAGSVAKGYARIRASVVDRTTSSEAAFVLLNVINNQSDGYPTSGYPMGVSIAMWCQDETRKTVPQPFVHEDLHELHLIVNSTGLHTGVDGVDYCVDPATTSITGMISLAVTLEYTVYASGEFQEIDNLRLYRGQL
jgi:hypothetical protein